MVFKSAKKGPEGQCIVVAQVEHHGREAVDLRIWQPDSKGRLKPTRTGATVQDYGTTSLENLLRVFKGNTDEVLEVDLSGELTSRLEIR
jgi:hypothetical protein